jgi:hypothetical protein
MKCTCWMDGTAVALEKLIKSSDIHCNTRHCLLRCLPVDANAVRVGDEHCSHVGMHSRHSSAQTLHHL